MEIDPPQSRLFVVCGRAIEVGCLGIACWLNNANNALVQADALQSAFEPYGCLQNVKIVKEKGGESAQMHIGRSGNCRFCDFSPGAMHAACIGACHPYAAPDAALDLLGVVSRGLPMRPGPPVPCRAQLQLNLVHSS